MLWGTLLAVRSRTSFLGEDLSVNEDIVPWDAVGTYWNTLKCKREVRWQDGEDLGLPNQAVRLVSLSRASVWSHVVLECGRCIQTLSGHTNNVSYAAWLISCLCKTSPHSFLLTSQYQYLANYISRPLVQSKRIPEQLLGLGKRIFVRLRLSFIQPCPSFWAEVRPFLAIAAWCVEMCWTYSFFAGHLELAPGWYCQNMARFDISPGGSLISLSCLQGALVVDSWLFRRRWAIFWSAFGPSQCWRDQTQRQPQRQSTWLSTAFGHDLNLTQ